MRSLRIALLGTPIVEVDGEPLSVDTRKAVALLAFLAVTGHAHSRAVVAELLWPELDREHSSAALRRTLSALRSGLGADRLRSDRNAISLVLDGAELDLARSREIAADPGAGIDTLREACELHRDDLLAGFGLRDSIGFDDWLRDAQDEIRRERALLLDRLTEALARTGHADEAVARARERLALDELHEPTHRRLIELYAWAGRRGDALTQYRDCVRVLDRELGVAPLPETTELYDAISAGTDVAVSSQPAEERPPVMEFAMVGRDAELARLLDIYGRIERDGSFVVIDGESGVGKTRLAQEALDQLRSAGAQVLAVKPGGGEQGLAYGVIASLLRAALDVRPDAAPELLRADAARLLPELGPPPPSSLEEPGAGLRFLESITLLITSALVADARAHRPAGAPRPAGVVFIDDLQWCDPASLDALAYLVRRLERRRILVICARRSDEPDPEHRFVRLAELSQRITLGRLNRADVVQLASAAGLEGAAVEQVYRESEGLPLFIAELLTAVGGEPDPVAGGGVRALLDARLDAVSEMSTQVLGAAAILGRSFQFSDVRAVSGRAPEELVSALDELAAHGLIVELEHGYDFSHERLRAAAEDRVGRARRRLLHARAAHGLAARHADHAIVARHFELAGDDQRAAEEYAVAGGHARSLSAWAEAIAHYEAALALGHPDAADLHEAIGDVHTLRGEYGAALTAYNSAAAYGDADRSARLEHKLGTVYERRGDWNLADHHYQQALTAADDVGRAEIQSDRSRVAWRRGDLDGARSLGFEALALAEAADADPAAARANNILGLLGCGRAHLQRSLELSASMHDPSVRIAALNNLALDHAGAGELADAETLTREALELCLAQGDRHHEAALRNNLADILHKAGRGEDAMEELKRAVTDFAVIGSEGEELYPGVWGLVEW